MTERLDELPTGAGKIARNYPAIWNAYVQLGEASTQAGPINGKTLRLVKLAFAIGIPSEGAVHSQVRRALADGLPKEELKHVALLAIPTLGLAQAVRALTWIEDITEGGVR